MATKGKKILGTEGKDVVFERFNGRASFVIKSRTHLIQERVKMISFTKVSKKKKGKTNAKNPLPMSILIAKDMITN